MGNDRDAYLTACEKIAAGLAAMVDSNDYSWGTSLDDPSIVSFTARVAMGDTIVLGCRKDSVFIKNMMRKVKKVATDSAAAAENRC